MRIYLKSGIYDKKTIYYLVIADDKSTEEIEFHIDIAFADDFCLICEVVEMEESREKLRQFFDGRIVRKDLTKKIKEGANVPVYVLEFLLGQYCSSDDPEVIETGVENVKRILADNYVRPDEAQKVLSMLQPERGFIRLLIR